jgi:hypothetical protein
MPRQPIKKHQRGVWLFVLQWLVLRALRYVRDLSSKGSTKVHSHLDALFDEVAGLISLGDPLCDLNCTQRIHSRIAFSCDMSHEGTNESAGKGLEG